ncbi:Uncharacterised protein [Vibrio cholerae]|nr:Uncharacterised protein [Vibrio cholerae]CSD77462.1 Uncharacterised protein [Vibrio cholerae]
MAKLGQASIKSPILSLRITSNFFIVLDKV